MTAKDETAVFFFEEAIKAAPHQAERLIAIAKRSLGYSLCKSLQARVKAEEDRIRSDSCPSCGSEGEGTWCAECNVDINKLEARALETKERIYQEEDSVIVDDKKKTGLRKLYDVYQELGQDISNAFDHGYLAALKNAQPQGSVHVPNLFPYNLEKEGERLGKLVVEYMVAQQASSVDKFVEENCEE